MSLTCIWKVFMIWGSCMGPIKIFPEGQAPMGMCDCSVTIILSPFYGPRTSNCCRLTLTHKECSVLMIVHWRTRRAILKHFLLLRLYWTLRVWHRSKFNSVLTRLTLSCTNAKELNTGLSDQKDSTPPRMKFLAHLFLFAKEFRQLLAWLTKRGQSSGQWLCVTCWAEISLCKMSPEEESKQDLPDSSSMSFIPWSPRSETVLGPRGAVSLHGDACPRGHEFTSVLQDVSEPINSALAL